MMIIRMRIYSGSGIWDLGSGIWDLGRTHALNHDDDDDEKEDQQQVILPPCYVLYDMDVILWITEESETLAHHSLPCTQPIFF